MKLPRVLITLAFIAAARLFGAAPDSELPPELLRKTEAALARSDLADYRGWLKYLRFLAEHAAERKADPKAAAERLATWVDRVANDPAALSKLRGVQEWAYESAVDGSGQPFKIVLPSDYVPGKPVPLSVYMHGYTGNHLEHSAGWEPQPGLIQLAVLGRSRSAGNAYHALGEADVLAVIDYVVAHWAVDPDRIRLNGGSMGGGGTYRLGARYPHRWASGQPTCGFLSFEPIGNLLTFPIYATHSADDPVVSVLHDRGPLARLRALGGQVVYDETNGYGHAVWEYQEGNQRGAAWVKQQVRPRSTSVRHLDYTALDGVALRGWWGEIVEWGDAPRPARFVLQVGDNNTVYAQLTNIARLRLRLAESPLDRSQPLHVSVNGGLPFTLAGPLPESVVLTRGDKGWDFEASAPALPYRLHTPGGATLLYDGEPLLIVYGTGGTPEQQSALKAAAVAASKGATPVWVQEGGEAGSDGVPHSQNLYGWLNTKADRDVTAEDIARDHLVLLGTAEQNSVVRRLAPHLPVAIEGGEVTTTDGARFPFTGCALGLVYYNPEAPQRLIFWVASDNVAGYAANAAVPNLMGSGLDETPAGADLMVMRTATPTLVAARSFDSRWQWTRGEKDAPLVAPTVTTGRDFSAALGRAICASADTDVALVPQLGEAETPAFVSGVTRLSDVLPLYYYSPIGACTMTGAELNVLATKAAAAQGSAATKLATTSGIVDSLAPNRRYRVAIPVEMLWPFSGLSPVAPTDYRLIEPTVYEAVQRHFPRED